MKKILVVYFSCGGVTKRIAEYMQGVPGVSLFKIEAAQKYTDDDLLAANPRARACVEAENPKCRPELVNAAVDTSGYDVVVIGYPLWFVQAPKVIYTFLEKVSLRGKLVVPFCTSGGSSVQKSEETLHKTFPDLQWGVGKQFSYTSTKQNVENWIKNL